MKKNELKQGVAYLCNTRGTMNTYRKSIFQLAEANSHNRYYVIFKDGQPWQNSRSNNIYVSGCKNYGADCPKHSQGDGRIRCYSTDFRLMDIREEFFTAIKKAHAENQKRECAKDIRAERLARIAKRQREATRAELSKEFFSVINEAVGKPNSPWGGISSWTKFGDLTNDQMKALIEALSVKVGAQC